MNPTSASTHEYVRSLIADSSVVPKDFELTDESVGSMLKAVKDKPYAFTFDLMVRSGLRLGEALAAKWEDIDWDDSSIHVNRQVQEVANKVLVGTKRESQAR